MQTDELQRQQHARKKDDHQGQLEEDQIMWNSVQTDKMERWAGQEQDEKRRDGGVQNVRAFQEPALANSEKLMIE